VKAAAIVIETVRELARQKVLWILAALITLTLLVFALLLRTQLADGLLGSMSVVEPGGPPGGRLLQAEGIVRGMQLAVALFLYPVGILLSLAATAGLVPGMLEKGTIDLLLSRPIGRPILLLSRCLGGVLVAAVHLLYLVIGLGAILALKTGVFNSGFVASGLLMALYFACLTGFMALCGVLWRSTPVTMLLGAAAFFGNLVVRLPHEYGGWQQMIPGAPARFLMRAVVEALYYALPRTWDFASSATALILGRGGVAWDAVAATLLSGGAALGVAVFLFRRADF